ncbi:hypothetical protein SLS62_001352 [Diatrype stigma]|uniref:Uncharacterized protein n=1 Tax=Diatrype stigma TaxID=117547 RepID=A0AAN9VAF9_9PEZI
MQFPALLAAASALAAASGASAAAIQRDGPRLAQFRIFTAIGCYEGNQGFYTVDRSDTDACHSLANTAPGGGVQSVNLETWNLPAAEGCSFYIYTDASCTEGQREATLNVCNGPPTEGDAWNSWQVSCPAGQA